NQRPLASLPRNFVIATEPHNLVGTKLPGGYSAVENGAREALTNDAVGRDGKCQTLPDRA
ncbi:hypothetical protein, partial [Pandoraea sputorum]|uniref:hypothetical protein n=1 Tax=Pandoraea sputorum TaxID=93222 RepID=UPI001CD33169